MYLNKIGIVNYKSFKSNILDFNSNSPNTFIGINDAGKTAILKSIEKLLDKGSLKFIKDFQLSSDLSNTPIIEDEFTKILESLRVPAILYENDSIYFIGCFTLEKNDIDQIFIDNSSNLLKWSIESSPIDQIILIKKYSSKSAEGTYFICVKESEDSNLALWNTSQKVLSGKVKELSISKQDIENDNKQGRFSNLEKFRSIYNKLKTKLKWVEYADFLKKDRSLFPIYRYIDWNISLDDIKNIALDGMSSKISDYKNQLSQDAVKLSIEINDIVNKDLKIKMIDLLTDVPHIRSLKVGVSFSVNESISDIVINKLSSDGDINIESQGEGIKKQIWFAFLKWTNMQKIQESDVRKKFIWCFDEPEVHLFPTATRDLFNIIKNLARGNFQIFVSTHSTLFIDRLSIKDINKVFLKDGYSQLAKCSSVDDVHEALGVRNSDILFYDKFLAIEGDTDNYLIPYLYKLFFGKSLEDDAIQIINLQGKGNVSNNKRLLEQLLNDFKKPESCIIYVLDGDSIAITGSNIHHVGNCDIEDCFVNKVWLELVKTCCDIEITDDDLNGIRANLDKNEHNKKFHKLLSDKIMVHPQFNNKFLPAKGVDLYDALISVINKKELIPENICTILGKINSING